MTQIENSEIADWYGWMEKIRMAMPDPSLFVLDPLAYVVRHLENGGFGIQVRGMQGERMGCLLCCVPRDQEENLGRELFSEQTDLERVIHIEYAAVAPAYRGQRLQEKMIAEAERRLWDTHFRHAFATASPDNPPSVHSFLRQGYRILATKELYGGYLRHIFYKPLTSTLEIQI
jgi:ribosomal protein S18 acetylase RimI-like enzyme